MGLSEDIVALRNMKLFVCAIALALVACSTGSYEVDQQLAKHAEQVYDSFEADLMAKAPSTPSLAEEVAARDFQESQLVQKLPKEVATKHMKSIIKNGVKTVVHAKVHAMVHGIYSHIYGWLEKGWGKVEGHYKVAAHHLNKRARIYAKLHAAGIR